MSEDGLSRILQDTLNRPPKQTSFELEDDPDFWDFNTELADYWDDGYRTGDESFPRESVSNSVSNSVRQS